ncbi:hypothetical protein BDN71DRAFT_1560995 [Pleurotus eryngii]|uniref:Uncharacterized protein n=1 Tax=Pleurotus eryngii TaxID=5323 RepID=A0A9P5ZXA3_PLEER|nr:hypothetical protein BDN71DRAFT_1560995 [Pleurotus eryngii]
MSCLPTSSHSTKVNVLLPVVLDSPHPLKKALTDVYFAVVLPKDVSLKITNAVVNNTMVYQKGLKFMYIRGITTVLGTFFIECQRDSTPSTTLQQTVYCGCAMQALRQILRLPVRPLYGVVFENGVLRLIAVTVDATDNSYVVSFLLTGRCFGLTPFIIQVLQESNAHSWDLRDLPALVECFYCRNNHFFAVTQM